MNVETLSMHIQWTNALSLGVGDLDAQHQELFRRASRLLDALEAGKRADVAELIEYLHGYATTHFGLEEAWMREIGFPGFLRHKAEHDRFVSDLALIARDLDANGRSLGLAPFQLGQWLAQWLKKHIGGTDAELGRYLAKRSA
ncbi:bacteriohemerythrin [Anaeromyxobacter sp. Fw109-5]|uniref:bacteriohemerythrin n=1 Tax=Anaeromyxobacter sp. (strain Fw109-5) TaxID=404589 RepID=UPI0002DEA101|nr:bacteriohemerythrin [Anaeromyxobacter sp. Fw109-5]